MNKIKHVLAGVMLCAVVGGALAQDGIPVTPLSRARVIAPEEQVNEQARLQYVEMMGQAQKQGVLAAANDPQLKRLRAIAQRLIPFATRWNPAAAQWQWQVNLIKSQEVNAFCMPGGRIGFYSGIIDKLQLNDDEIAAVMGHEVAHALREHGRSRMGKSALTSIGARVTGLLASSILGVDPNITGTVANTLGQGLVLKFSRDEERESDLVGLDIAARAGYDPRAGIALWRKMAALNERTPLELLSTHPSGTTRIKDMEQNMHLLLPVYARVHNKSVSSLPAYQSAGIAR